MTIDFETQPSSRIDIHRATKQSQEVNAKPEQEAFWGNDGFGFDDLVDLVNPLQHIPIVSSIYRELTGDEIAPGPRMIGGAVVGGVTGFLASAANVIIENETGKDIGESIFALFDSEEQAAPERALANAQPLQSTKQLEVTLASARTYNTRHNSQERANGSPMELLTPHEAPLEPLDFGAVLAPTVPSSLPEQAPQYHAATAAAVLNDMTQQYRQQQWQSVANEMAREMKAES